MDIYAVHEFVCDDGSGTFTMKTHARVDYTNIEGQLDTRTWEIESGTGDYVTLSGSGDAPRVFADSPNEATSVFVGEVHRGSTALPSLAFCAARRVVHVRFP